MEPSNSPRLRSPTLLTYFMSTRELISIEDSVVALIGGLVVYIMKSKERLITATRNSTDNKSINRTTIENRSGKNSNSIDIFSVKLTKSHPRKSG